MISIGDIDPTETENATADPWTQGIGVLDMTYLVCRDSCQSEAEPYQPADAIKRYYNLKYVT